MYYHTNHKSRSRSCGRTTLTRVRKYIIACEDPYDPHITIFVASYHKRDSDFNYVCDIIGAHKFTYQEAQTFYTRLHVDGGWCVFQYSDALIQIVMGT